MAESLIPVYEELVGQAVELAQLDPPIRIPQFPNVNMTMHQAFALAMDLKQLTELRAIRELEAEASNDQLDLLRDILDKLNDIHEELQSA